MIPSNKLAKNSDSLIELLAAQCADLEKLLGLAREETRAAREGKFLEILDIVSERAAIGRRLETFQHQIAELRGCLVSNAESAGHREAAARVMELANLTLAEDQKTRLLLTDAREQAATDLKNLEKSQHGTNAYLRENTKGLAYNRKF